MSFIFDSHFIISRNEVPIISAVDINVINFINLRGKCSRHCSFSVLSPIIDFLFRPKIRIATGMPRTESSLQFLHIPRRIQGCGIHIHRGNSILVCPLRGQIDLLQGSRPWPELQLDRQASTSIIFYSEINCQK